MIQNLLIKMGAKKRAVSKLTLSPRNLIYTIVPSSYVTEIVTKITYHICLIFYIAIDWRDRHQLSRIVYAVAELFSGVHPVKYSQILEIDRRISEHIPPPHLHIPPEGSSMEEDGPLLIMQRIIPVICGDGCKFLEHMM